MGDVDHLSALGEAASALAGELSLSSVLETIVRHGRHVTGARYAALGIVAEDGTISRFITEGVTEEQIEAIGHYPTGKGILGLLIREPRLIRLDDIREHPDSFGFPPEHPEMTSFLGAPVRSGGKVYGNLYLTEKPGGFDDDDERILLVLAAQAGAAVENAILSERLRSIAVQDERDRISRELHDGIIQTLFSVGMGLESARGLLEVDPHRVDQRIDEAVEAIDGTIREMRNFIFQLRPQHAASMGFARGLTELAREYEVNALVRPTLEIPSDVDARMPEEMAPDVLAIVREALSNAAKHARASEVHVRLRLGEPVTLDIHDDGVGFDPASLSGGRGLENIAERVRALGAALDIDSAVGQGTRFRITIPVEGVATRQEEPT